MVVPIENIQRDDLAHWLASYRRMLDDGITQAALNCALGIGKTQSHIAGKLRLLELPEMLKCYLDAKLIE